MKNILILLVIFAIIFVFAQSSMKIPSKAQAQTTSYNPYEPKKTVSADLYQINRAEWNDTIYFMEVDWSYDSYYTDQKKNKKVGEVYKNTIIPRAIRYNGRQMRDTKEIRIAMYHAGIGTVCTAWKEASYTGKDWRMYLPDSTQDFMKNNSNMSYRKIK